MGPTKRRVRIDTDHGLGVYVEAEPQAVSPKRAQAIIDAEQAKRYPWQGSGLAGDATPGEEAWLRWYWEQLPGHYCFYSALHHRASGRDVAGVDYVIEDGGNTFRVL